MYYDRTDFEGVYLICRLWGAVVAISWERFEGISWIGLIIIVTLLSLRQAAPQQSKASFDCIRFALSLHQI